VGRRAAKAALAVVGRPYRYGGADPQSGFDCSGLVTWSYRRAGLADLPRTAEDLERLARPVSLDEVEPGDLLFFRLTGKKKTSHVALYIGGDRFVHAPSSGKGVEVVSFDHVYWSRHLRRAGRIAH
jgi:cell wall-associated NlpC family hydrolase